MLRGRVAEAGCAIAYVNQVGGQDELVFDGASLVVGADGRLLAAGRQFGEDLVVVDVPLARPRPRRPARPSRSRPSRSVRSGARRARPPPRHRRSATRPRSTRPWCSGTRDYLAKNGFTDAVVGLSGGIDSSLVATVAVDALGPDHVHGLAMPSRYSSDGSVSDAEALADRLGIDLAPGAHRARPTWPSPTCWPRCSADPPTGLADENLQSRLRGVLLMAVSNATGAIVLTTGNKSEMATGYSTLYGDSAGGFAVIKDVPKTLVYELCRYRNARAEAAGRPGPIPESVLDKPPSAELRPDQRDDQSLPPYELLDPVLAAYVEHDRTAADLVAEGFDPELVRAGGGPGRRGRVQAAPDAPGRAHHHQGLRQGPPDAHHQPLPRPAAAAGRPAVG